MPPTAFLNPSAEQYKWKFIIKKENDWLIHLFIHMLKCSKFFNFIIEKRFLIINFNIFMSSQLRFGYFNFYGRGQICRLLLAYT